MEYFMLFVDSTLSIHTVDALQKKPGIAFLGVHSLCECFMLLAYIILSIHTVDALQKEGRELLPLECTHHVSVYVSWRY